MRKSSCLQYHQHVTCYTRNNVTSDLFYSNVKDAYTTVQLARPGNGDHHLIHLVPRYKPLVKRIKPTKMVVQRWTEDAIQKLQGSLACTDRSVFTENCSDIHELVETVSNYINFCVETCIPTKTVTAYPNNKTWIAKQIKDVINTTYYRG